MFEIEKANRRATGGREDISDLRRSLAESSVAWQSGSGNAVPESAPMETDILHSLQGSMGHYSGQLCVCMDFVICAYSYIRNHMCNTHGRREGSRQQPLSV